MKIINYRKQVCSVIYLVIPIILVLSGIIGIYTKSEDNNPILGENQLYFSSYSPFNVSLNINCTPALNETFEITSSVKSDVNISEVEIQISLPAEIEHVSGNLNWTGEILENDVENLTILARIVTQDEFAVYSSAVDQQLMFYSNNDALFFYVNESDTKVYDFPHREDPDIPIRATMVYGNPPGDPPGQGDSISVYGTWKYNDEDDSNFFPIAYARVKLEGDTVGGPYEDTTFTDDTGYYEFTDLNPGDYRVIIYTETHQDSDHDVVRVAENLQYDDDDLYSWDTGWRYLDLNNVDDWFFDGRCTGNFRAAWAIYHNILDEYLWFRDYPNVEWDWTEHEPRIRVRWCESIGGSSFSYNSPSDYWINIAEHREWDRPDHFHEFAHAIMYIVYGGWLPDVEPGDHGWGWEKTRTHAMAEGWPNFIENAIDNNPDGNNIECGCNCDGYVFADNNVAPFGDFGDWDGQKVEGAVSSVFWDIFDGVEPLDYPYYEDIDGDFFSFSQYGDYIDNQFDKLWEIIRDDHPGHIDDFWDEWVENNGASTDICMIFYNHRIKKAFH